MSIGKKLLSLRQEKGISQEALGRELNVSSKQCLNGKVI